MNSWPNALQVQTFAFLFYFDKHLISWIHSTMKSIKWCSTYVGETLIHCTGI